MPNGQDWSRIEVEACVADYLRMLTLELNGQRYNKTEHANALLQKLDNRKRASVEFKHCNISAVLNELRHPGIVGYKPRGNYQTLLADVVESQLADNLALQAAVQAAVIQPAVEVSVANPAAMWVEPPMPVNGVRETSPVYARRHLAVKRDYLAQEASNRSLGRAGELLVLELESRRLYVAGKKSLSDRVEHVAATRGDGLGYDVLSFEENGRERLIEVKTTAFGQFTPFYVSRNELSRSKTDAEQFHLYRLFDFRDKPRLFDLPGAIPLHCRLEEVTYLARVGICAI